MRNFEECKAEVFRRSEVRIKQRKKKIARVVAACVPLVLCLGLWIYLINSGLFFATNDAAPENAGWSESYSEEYYHFFQDKEVTYGANETPLAGTATQIIFLHIEGETYGISGDMAAQLSEILSSLAYSPHKVCRCLPQFKIETETMIYGIHLSEGYARCEEGQAAMTKEQIGVIRSIVDWAKTQKPIG